MLPGICVWCAVCSRVYGVFAVCPRPTGDKTGCKNGRSTRPVPASVRGSTATLSCRSRGRLQRSSPSDIRWPPCNNAQHRVHLSDALLSKPSCKRRQQLCARVTRHPTLHTPRNPNTPPIIIKRRLRHGSPDSRLLLPADVRGTNQAFRVLGCEGDLFVLWGRGYSRGVGASVLIG